MPSFIMTAEVRLFWQHMVSLTMGEAPPKYTDLDLMDIHRLVPNVLVLDVERGSGRLLIRFIGTMIVDMFGYETTGRYMDEINIGPHQEKLLAVYDEAVASRSPHWTLAKVTLTDAENPFVSERKGFTYERLVCPFCGPAGDVTQLVALLTCRPSDIAGEDFMHRPITWP